MTQRDDLLGRVKELRAGTDAHRATSRSIRQMIFDGDYAAATTALDALEADLHQAVGGGPGGGLTNPITEGVTIAPTDPEDVPLRLEVPAGAQNSFGTDILTVKRDPDESESFGNQNVVTLDNNGGLVVFSSTGIPATWSIHDDDTDESVYIAGGGIGIGARSATSSEPEAIWVNDADPTLPNPSISFWKNGVLKFSGTAFRSDGDMNAGECYMRFDKTNGAARVMFRGKTANGTVVHGEVPLAP